MEIGFIGAGKVGKALGLYFKAHGLKIAGYYSRTSESAAQAAAMTFSKAFAALKALADSSDVVFIAVPDQSLAEIDSKISDLMQDRSIDTENIWIHVSGAHPSDCLAGIKSAGSAVGSMHPLQSFGDPRTSAAKLDRTWFTLEGTGKAVVAIKEILDKTGGKYSLINVESKPLYHAGACVVSNFLTTLLESGIRFFEASGMDRKKIFNAIEPLIDATLANMREKGPIEALTGPIVRGDYNTITVHLKAMEAHLPSELDFYSAMALKTVRMLEDRRLTHTQAEEFRHILEETDHV